MKKVVYPIFLILSFLMILPLLLLYHVWAIDSQYYYISNFKENKMQFERVAKLKVEESTSENIEISHKTELERLKTELQQDCRVDSVDSYIFSNNKVYVIFPMSDSMHYPSTEHVYRMILYQPNDELPEKLNRFYNKRISKNWFYVARTPKTSQRNLIMVFLMIFVFSVWIKGIIKLTKILKLKSKL